MAHLTQEVFVELLLLPAGVMAFATSLLTARAIGIHRRLADDRPPGLELLIVWHVAIAACGFVCGGVLLLDQETDDLMFTDPAEVLFILLAWLGIRGPGGGWQPTTQRNLAGQLILAHVMPSNAPFEPPEGPKWKK